MAGGALLNASVLAVQLEKVRSKVPELFGLPTMLWARIEKKGEVISNRDARIPLKLRSGGAFGKYNPDGGDMGSGTAPFFDYATIGSSHFKVGFELTKLARLGTNSGEKAVLNAVKDIVKDSTAQLRNGLDQAMNQDYTGELGTVSSISGDVITLSASGLGSAFKANARFQVGQRLQVVNTGITGLDNAGEAVGPISLVDPSGGKITLDGSGAASVIATDRLFLENSTFNLSTNAATSVGLFGITYHQNNSSSGTWLSKTRSSFPELWTPTVSASSTDLSLAHIRLAKNLIKIYLQQEPGKLVAYCGPAQQHAYEALGQMISEIHKGGSDSDSLDLFFNEDSMKMAGTPMLVSTNADPTRIDFLDLDKWGRVVTEEIELMTVGGTSMFPKYGGSGGLAASEIGYLTTSTQIFNENPRAGAYISSLNKPSTSY